MWMFTSEVAAKSLLATGVDPTVLILSVEISKKAQSLSVKVD